ncbi:MAG: hypothetical protein QOJ19_4852 [Acidimicrobiia bacterium]|nr:hypothetical protein [Acidimicrobiia bacterium]
MAAPVPAELSELTASWVTAALAEGDRLPFAPEVATVRLERVGQSTGFLGQLARLHLDYRRGEGPSTVIAKLPTLDPGGRSVGRMLDVWTRESRFFAEVAPHCRAKVPDCLYNGAEPEAGRWTLLLEDCGPGQEADQLVGATDAQAAEAVAALARLQAPFWGEPLPFRWMPGFHRPGFEMLQAAMQSALPRFISAYGDRVTPRTLAWLTTFVDQLPRWAAEHEDGPLTLVHADYRLDNLLYGADGTVTIIDWQTALWGPGPMDLASFLATSLTVDRRRHLESALLSEYAVAVGAAAAHVEQVYRSCLLWWMAIFANNLSRLDPSDERSAALFDRMITGTFGAADDWDAGDLLI